MVSTDRRTVLASFGALTVGGLAGCSILPARAPPAGSLRFENGDDLPHSITVSVTDVGAEPGAEPGSVDGEVTAPPSQRTLTASTTVAPGDRETYEGVFTEPVWYAVRFAVDGRTPEDAGGTTRYYPAPREGEAGRTLSAEVNASGEFSWVISATENAGPFDLEPGTE